MAHAVYKEKFITEPGKTYSLAFECYYEKTNTYDLRTLTVIADTKAEAETWAEKYIKRLRMLWAGLKLNNMINLIKIDAI